MDRGLKQRARDYWMLNKPLVVALLLFTTLTAMVVAGGSLPSLTNVIWTLLGGALAAGGANAINQYFERDLDRAMKRTENRPLPAGRLTPAGVLGFGSAACLAALGILAGLVNWPAALLALGGMIYYLIIYTLWLKRRTVHNIVIGGGAGAMPVLVGWAAATGTLSWGVLVPAALVLLWTPAHFWALALARQDDYAAAGIPMRPVVYGAANTHQHILGYSLAMVIFSLLAPLFNIGSSLYWVIALVSGGPLLFLALRLRQQGGKPNALRLYYYSNYYLALLFLGLILDTLF